MISHGSGAAISAVALALFGGCGGNDDAGLPQLSAATGATLASCTDLATRITFANTAITAANAVAAGSGSIEVAASFASR